MYFSYCDTPIGVLLLAGDASGLHRIGFSTDGAAQSPAAEWEENDDFFCEATRQLAAYFAGELSTFDLPLAPQGTPFQLQVWRALQDIPYGQTLSYGELAQKIGTPNASRAVGAANGQNPLPIVIPCHRVVGSNGRLAGYAGGLETKKALLSLELRHSFTLS